MAAIAASFAFSEAVFDDRYLSAIGTSRVMCGSNSNNCAITFGHIRSLPLIRRPMPFGASVNHRRPHVRQVLVFIILHFESPTTSQRRALVATARPACPPSTAESQ